MGQGLTAPPSEDVKTDLFRVHIHDLALCDPAQVAPEVAREVRPPCVWPGRSRHCSRLILPSGGNHVVLLELRRDSRVMTGNLGFLLLALKSNLPFGRGSQPSPWVGPGKPNLPLELRGNAGGGARVTDSMDVSLSELWELVMDRDAKLLQSCPTLWDPMNRSMAGLPVHHQLPEFTTDLGL